MNLKKDGEVFTSKFVGTGPSSYEKRIYRATVSQSFKNADLEPLFHTQSEFYPQISTYHQLEA